MVVYTPELGSGCRGTLAEILALLSPYSGPSCFLLSALLKILSSANHMTHSPILVFVSRKPILRQGQIKKPVGGDLR